jgi:acyl carrier protein
MERTEVFSQAVAVMARIFKASPEQFSDATKAADVQGWDSLSHLILISGLEKQFDIEIPMDAAYVAQNVGELVDLVTRSIAEG